MAFFSQMPFCQSSPEGDDFVIRGSGLKKAAAAIQTVKTPKRRFNGAYNIHSRYPEQP